MLNRLVESASQNQTPKNNEEKTQQTNHLKIKSNTISCVWICQSNQNNLTPQHISPCRFPARRDESSSPPSISGCTMQCCSVCFSRHSQARCECLIVCHVFHCTNHTQRQLLWDPDDFDCQCLGGRYMPNNFRSNNKVWDCVGVKISFFYRKETHIPTTPVKFHSGSPCWCSQVTSHKPIHSYFRWKRCTLAWPETIISNIFNFLIDSLFHQQICRQVAS